MDLNCAVFIPAETGAYSLVGSCYRQIPILKHTAGVCVLPVLDNPLPILLSDNTAEKLPEPKWR